MSAFDRIRSVIERHGPISFDRYMDLALYDDDGGFFAGGAGAGRRADFLTSPEVGPLFGQVVATALDRWWDELGQPGVYTVVECGAGRGMLAASILAAAPRCSPALRYVLVERAADLRRQQQDRLPIEPSTAAFVAGPSDLDDGPRPTRGPIVLSLASLPLASDVVGVVLANELLDNLPFALLERTASGWAELLVGFDGRALVPVLTDPPPGSLALANELAPEAEVGSRIPVEVGVWSWLTDALAIIERGRLVAFDYVATTAEMAAGRGWLRTYRGHERGGDPFSEPGTKDITGDVAVDQLHRVRQPSSTRSQADFLRAFGIDEHVALGRAVWAERAHLGDLAALTARSRVNEAAALTDPAGLGGFTVLEWLV